MAPLTLLMKILVPALFFSLLLGGCSKSFSIEDLTGPEALHSRTVGASAGELLKSEKYKSLKIEIQYMPGYAPDAAALDHLKSMLAGLVNKPGGITVHLKEIPAATTATLSAQDLVELEKQHRTVFSTGEAISVYILYTNGQYTSESTLGVAYRNTSAALFGKKIQENSGGIGQVGRTRLEATVLEHEMAHLLGLVDIGSPMQSDHKDAAHGSHCNNPSCLMYYASETTDVLGFLMTGNIPTLDESCRADLKANGGL
jgi:hypothetical protein